MARKQRNSTDHQRTLRFERLEPRRLLVTTGFPQFDGDSPFASNMISNGDFEVYLDNGDSQSVVDFDQVAGWFRPGENSQPQLKLREFPDSPRGMVVALDSSADVLDRIAQDVLLDGNSDYYLLFDLRGTNITDSSADTTNDLRLIWDGIALGTFRGVDFWQTFAVPISGNGNVSQLEFREIEGNGNDGSGPLLDNVRLVQVEDSVLTNGGFDSFSTAQTVEATDVPGWSAMGEAADQTMQSRVEDQRRFINLDTSQSHLDRIYQDFDTTANMQYLISFDLKAASGTSAATEELRVRWNNDWVGTYRGDSNWQRFSFVVEATSDRSRLVLREPPVGLEQAGDGSGPLVDNVSVAPIRAVEFDIVANQTQLLNYLENSAPLVLAPQLELDGSSDLSEAFAQIDNGTNSELLDVDLTGTSLQKSYDSGTGRLIVTGNASALDYQRVLRSLTYENISEQPAAKPTTVSLRVGSGNSTYSRSTSIGIYTTAQKDAPVVQSQSDGNAVIDTEFSRTVQASDAEDAASDLIFELTYSGDAVQSGDRIPEINGQGVISWTPSREGTLTITVTVSDTDGFTDSTTFRVDVDETSIIETGDVQLLSGNPLPAYTIPDLAVGNSLANFQAQTMRSETLEFTGDGTARIFGFFAHWCPFCQQELPEITDWLNNTSLPNDVEVVAVSVGVNEASSNYPPSEWFEQEQFPGTVLVDDTNASLESIFGLTSFPFWVAVDGDGVVAERIAGPITEGQLNSMVSQISFVFTNSSIMTRP